MQDVFAPAPVKLHNDLAHKVIYEMELKSKNKVKSIRKNINKVMANILPRDLLLSIKTAESSLVTHQLEMSRIWAGILDS